MIQEKDFLYRVPVKTAPITTPRGQIRNPEILVDLEGGEFMHGNILDANSTNKLINQSVKDAVDDKFIESGYVTKDLLDAETSARTKGDEDLGANIKAEQTRAEGKEKEISDKLAIVDGDSNTEGSFRKAIAELGPKADRSDLITLEQKITANTTAIKGKQDKGDYVAYSSEDYDNYYFHKGFISSVPFAVDDSDGNQVEYGINGITSSNNSNCLATSDGTFKPISDFASADDVSSLRVGLSKKQDKITVNEVNVTDIKTADITKLRTIVTNLINALSASNLIRQTVDLE